MPAPQLELQPLPELELEPRLLPLLVLVLMLVLRHLLGLPPMPGQQPIIGYRPKLQLEPIVQPMAIVQLAGPLVVLQLVLVERQLAELVQRLAMSLVLALVRPTRRQQGQPMLIHRHHPRRALPLFERINSHSNLSAIIELPRP